ncbi:RNA polymerase sigma factor [Akkermansiaceae bacterium]|nr:RNA polymerase sigma factor [Akkermansiaceae bacterium]
MGIAQTKQEGSRPDREWNRFLDSQGDALLLFARQLTRTDSDAKDLTQQVLIEAWKFSRGKVPDKALVFSMLRRRAIDMGRSKDRRAQREVDYSENREDWFAPNFEKRDDAARLEEALGFLPDTLREVVVLRIWGDLSFPEIAQTTGVTVATATSRFRYGIERLRKSDIINELKT